jgi:hypothetical protein
MLAFSEEFRFASPRLIAWAVLIACGPDSNNEWKMLIPRSILAAQQTSLDGRSNRFWIPVSLDDWIKPESQPLPFASLPS